MEECKYNLEIPTIGTCCGAYSKAKRTDGKHWSHYPECAEENCPMKHPELLDGATLKSEV